MSEEQDMDAVAERYHRRRTVEAGVEVEVVVEDIGIIEHNGSEQIGISIDVAGEAFVVIDDVPESWDTENALIQLLENASPDTTPPFSIDAVIGETASMYFGDKMNSCGFKSADSYPHRLRRADEVTMKRVADSDIDNRLSLAKTYHDASPTEEGWLCEVISVDALGDEKLAISAATGAGSTINWEVKLPKTTEADSHATARLIETVGYGDPRNLVNEEVYVVAAEDADQYLTTVGIDETGQWYLVTPADFEEWDENKQQATSSNSSSSTSRRSTQKRANRRKGNSQNTKQWKNAMVHGFAQALLLTIIEPFIFDALALGTVIRQQAENPQQAQELLNMITGIVELMTALSLFLGIFGAVMYILTSSVGSQ